MILNNFISCEHSVFFFLSPATSYTFWFHTIINYLHHIFNVWHIFTYVSLLTEYRHLFMSCRIAYCVIYIFVWSEFNIFLWLPISENCGILYFGNWYISVKPQRARCPAVLSMIYHVYKPCTTVFHFFVFYCLISQIHSSFILVLRYFNDSKQHIDYSRVISKTFLIYWYIILSNFNIETLFPSFYFYS